jgi:hypothetical protein
MCKAGVRSAKMLLILKEAGITGSNLTGGIHAWSQEIDSSIPQYSIQDIYEFQPFLAAQRSMKQRWLTGGGLAVASLAVAAAITMPHSSDLKRAQVQADVSLGHVSNLTKLSTK